MDDQNNNSAPNAEVMRAALEQISSTGMDARQCMETAQRALATPPAAERAQGGLTDEQIIELHDSMFPRVPFERDKIMGNVVRFARAILASQSATRLGSAPPSDPVQMVMGAIAAGQKRRAAEPSEPVGNMSVEFPPRAAAPREQAAERAAVPEGWKLAPVEVTDKMREAFASAEYTFRYEGEDHPGMLYEFRHQYAAMLAAAPSPAAQEGKALDGWISVDDRMPKNNDVVAIIGPAYGDWSKGRYTNIVTFIDGMFYDDDGNYCHPPSHWAPVPEAPAAQQDSARVAADEVDPLTVCAAARDGDCSHAQCPQLRDNEPHATGRHCPLDSRNEDD